MQFGLETLRDLPGPAALENAGLLIPMAGVTLDRPIAGEDGGMDTP